MALARLTPSETGNLVALGTATENCHMTTSPAQTQVSVLRPQETADLHSSALSLRRPDSRHLMIAIQPSSRSLLRDVPQGGFSFENGPKSRFDGVL